MDTIELEILQLQIMEIYDNSLKVPYIPASLSWQWRSAKPFVLAPQKRCKSSNLWNSTTSHALAIWSIFVGSFDWMCEGSSIIISATPRRHSDALSISTKHQVVKIYVWPSHVLFIYNEATWTLWMFVIQMQHKFFSAQIKLIRVYRLQVPTTLASPGLKSKKHICCLQLLSFIIAPPFSRILCLQRCTPSWVNNLDNFCFTNGQTMSPMRDLSGINPEFRQLAIYTFNWSERI